MVTTTVYAVEAPEPRASYQEIFGKAAHLEACFPPSPGALHLSCRSGFGLWCSNAEASVALLAQGNPTASPTTFTPQQTLSSSVSTQLLADCVCFQT